MESFHEVFSLVCEECRSKMAEVAYSLWFRDIEPLSFDGNTAVLVVKSEFKKNILIEKYQTLLEEAFEKVLGFPVQVVIRYAGETAAPREQAPAAPQREEAAQGGEYEYTFSTFIVGSSNKFAHAASLAVATNPANAYNPLFIYGGSGLGKTHLLLAICNELLAHKPDTNIIYCKGEEFTNELINAIATKTTKEFHDKYRQADVLLVDDIQFIAGKDSTQEEFFHTFNTLYEAGKQIVLTSDRPPKEIKTLEDRLRTRFEWGLLADIQPPDFETRYAIISRKAQLMDLELPEDIIEYIATRLKNNIRQLEGAVKKIKAYHILAGSPPSMLIAQNAIRDILNDNQPVPVTVEKIISEVGRTYGVSAADIKSKKRSAPISKARQVAMYIVREITQMSTTGIGEEFGGRHHSTVVYALEEVEKTITVDTHYKETIEDIIKNIRDN